MSGKSIRKGRSYIETLLADLKSKHGEVEGIKEACELLSAQLEATLVGQEPLPVDGVDVDGKRFQLKQYRGKVIVLDFFANWCPHCKVMYPHERELVEKYAEENSS